MKEDHRFLPNQICKSRESLIQLLLMNDHLTEYKHSKLFYQKTGVGQKVLLAFHGFGQDHKAFNLLAQALKDDYTIYSFDLYFHGKSEWHYDEKPLEKEFWKEVMVFFLLENKIDKFSLAGYSLGCRFAMATVEQLTTQVESIFLLAPDGINISFWYSIATYPTLFRKFFKSMITHPSRFKIIVNTIHEARMMDKGLLKFADHQMNTKEKRKKVYYSWVVFRHLKFNLKNITDLITRTSIPITVIVGKQDHVIKPSSMKNFIKYLPHVNFQIVDTGHAALLKDSAIIPFFKTNSNPQKDLMGIDL